MTTQTTQSLPTELLSILCPTPTSTPNLSVTTTATLNQDAENAPGALGDKNPDCVDPDNKEPIQRYHIEVPPTLPGTASHQELQVENNRLHDIITQAGVALEENFAQMKLMELENERLRKCAFKKDAQKSGNNLPQEECAT